MSTAAEALFFSCADYATWNQLAFITLEEFIYLINGHDPLGTRLHDKKISANDLVGYEQVFIDFSESKLDEFNYSWKKITLLGRELPVQSDAQTEVRYLKDKLPRYEAVFLLQWAKSKNIKIHQSYNPVETQERKNRQFIRNFIGRQVISRNEIVQVLVKYNPDLDEKYFHEMLFDAVKAQNPLEIIYKARNVYKDDPSTFNYDFTKESLIEYAVQMKWNLPEEFHNNTEAKQNIRSYFRDGEIMVDGVIDVRKIQSTKLVLALENYIIHMRQDSKKIPSTESVKKELVSNYGQDGVTEAMARIIDECSRHDTRANNPPKSAREKTIFFQ